MENRYHNIVNRFVLETVVYLKELHNKPRIYDVDPELGKVMDNISNNLYALCVNPDAILKQVVLNPKWFSKTDGDCRAYFAFLEVYHALVRYYEYRAKYNMKDAELENALNNWDKISRPKQNVFSAVINKLSQKKVK